jgi:oligopeptide transport system ATP-binding protein
MRNQAELLGASGRAWEVSSAPGQPILEVRGLTKWFPIRRGFFQKAVAWVHAVDGIDLQVPKGGILGLVGESGCGKSTVGRLVLRLLEPDRGSILFEGQEITALRGQAMKDFRRKVQIVFQDPYGSLNPRMTVGQMLEEGLRQRHLGGAREMRERVGELLERVGLPARAASRYPHEFSGGQRQRIGIARALTVEPALVVCDEPVSALDVSVQAQIINLLLELQRDMGLSYLFISHDLHLVRYVSHQVAIMYGGQIMEYAPAEALESRVFHPYSKGLWAALPAADPAMRREPPLLGGEVGTALDPPPGCRFQARCWLVEERCRQGEIRFYPMEGHLVRCWKVAGQ